MIFTMYDAVRHDEAVADVIHILWHIDGHTRPSLRSIRTPPCPLLYIRRRRRHDYDGEKQRDCHRLMS
jgi:hypothetical protein